MTRTAAHLSAKTPAITDLPVTERGPWLATSLGGMWSIEHPHSRDVFLDDLAWGMARTCRYGGQLKHSVEMYSVAEHATSMTWWAIEQGRVRHLEDALAILLHDAAEAYYGDIPTPLKKMMPGYRDLEDAAQAVILGAFGLTSANTLIRKPEIKEIDERIRIDERLHFIAEPALSAGLEVTWEKDPDMKPLGVAVDCLLPSQARAAFMACLAWTFENLPARDPQVLEVMQEHLAQVREPVPPARPAVFQDAGNPFAQQEQAQDEHDTEIAV